MALHTIELCSGVGMLGEGLRAGLGHLGIETRTVCHVEREAYAAAVLAARMEEGSLDEAPIWSDLCTFDARAFRGKVDCIAAGFPCQDLSVAGKRAGLDGARSGLFFEVCRIATDSGAWLMFLENVGGIASATATVMDQAEGELEERAASRVVGELADLGWDSEWLHVSASEVGASHRRERWFCFAWKVGHPGLLPGIAKHWEQPEGSSGRAGQPSEGVCVANTTRERFGEARECCSKDVCLGAGRTGPELADASRPGREGSELGSALLGNRGGQEAHGSTSQFRGLFALDRPMSDGAKSSSITPNSTRRLSPIFVEWLMGWPLQWTKADPSACGAAETALWRSKLQQHLSCLLGEQGSSSREAA